MRERLDCAIFEFDDGVTPRAQLPMVACYANERLFVHTLPLPTQHESNIRAFASMALMLRRYDACLLRVSALNLAWVRQALQAARPALDTPIIGVLHELRAPAIDDLYSLGMADFVCEPVCYEELRARVQRLLDSRLMVHTTGAAGNLNEPGLTIRHGGQATYNTAVASDDMPMPLVAAGLVNDSATEALLPIEQGDRELEAFAIASASRCAHTSDSFSTAKSKVIARFERAYLLASLASSSGNITMAARRARKHRRAYWALMQKHAIDAAPFRNQGPR